MRPQFDGGSIVDGDAERWSREVRTDAQLIRQSVHEPELFGSIFDRHHRTVAAFLAATVGVEAGQDLMSETFLRAFVRRDRFRLGYDSARGWLLGIAGNLRRLESRRVAREARACARLARSEDYEDPIPAVLSQLDSVASARTLGVWTAVGGLPRAERTALLLYALRGLSYREIASATGVPIGTVRSRLSRARHKVTRSMGEVVLGDRPRNPPDRSCRPRRQGPSLPAPRSYSWQG